MVSLHFYNFFLILGFLYLVTIGGCHANRPCNGSISECNEEGETLMESEISRRILAAKKYITPGAMKPDQPVCKGSRGEAYTKASDCLPESSNNPHRGCQRYYHCRS